MKQYSFLQEFSYSLPVGSTLGGGALGYLGGSALSKLIIKRINTIKEKILSCKTIKEFYLYLIENEYSDNIMDNASKRTGAEFINYTLKLMYTKDPDWKNKLINRLDYYKKLSIISTGIFGTFAGAMIGGSVGTAVQFPSLLK